MNVSLISLYCRPFSFFSHESPHTPSSLFLFSSEGESAWPSALQERAHRKSIRTFGRTDNGITQSNEPDPELALGHSLEKAA